MCTFSPSSASKSWPKVARGGALAASIFVLQLEAHRLEEDTWAAGSRQAAQLFDVPACFLLPAKVLLHKVAKKNLKHVH